MDEDLRDELIAFIDSAAGRAVLGRPELMFFTPLGEFVWAVLGNHPGVVEARKFVNGVRA